MPLPGWWQGLTNGYGTGVLEGRRAGYGEFTCADGTTIYSQTLTRLTFTAPDGTEFELRDQLNGGRPSYNGNCGNYLNPPSRGTLFVTADGSAATFISDAPITDVVVAPDGGDFLPSGYLLLRDGTRYRINGGRVSWVRDRDGNLMTFGYDTSNRVTLVTDSLGRRATITYAPPDAGDDRITFAGFGGVERALIVTHDSLQNALRHTRAGDPASPWTYNNLFPTLSSPTQPSIAFNPTVVTAMTLPDGRSYRFLYNQYGELARVELPTGGAFEYDWAYTFHEIPALLSSRKILSSVMGSVVSEPG